MIAVEQLSRSEVCQIASLVIWLPPTMFERFAVHTQNIFADWISRSNVQSIQGCLVEKM